LLASDVHILHGWRLERCRFGEDDHIVKPVGPLNTAAFAPIAVVTPAVSKAQTLACLSAAEGSGC